MTEHEYHHHLAKSADAFDAEIDRYEAILNRIRDVLRRQQVKVDSRRERAKSTQFRLIEESLEKEADMIERVLDAVRKALGDSANVKEYHHD